MAYLQCDILHGQLEISWYGNTSSFMGNSRPLQYGDISLWEHWTIWLKNVAGRTVAPYREERTPLESVTEENPQEIWELRIAYRKITLINIVISFTNIYWRKPRETQEGWEHVIGSVINTSVKFILEDVTGENHEEYKEGRKCFIQRLYRHSDKFCFGNCYEIEPQQTRS